MLSVSNVINANIAGVGSFILPPPAAFPLPIADLKGERAVRRLSVQRGESQ